MKAIKEFIIANTNIATLEDLEFMDKIPVDVCVRLMEQYHASQTKMPSDNGIYVKSGEEFKNIRDLDKPAYEEFLELMNKLRIAYSVLKESKHKN